MGKIKIDGSIISRATQGEKDAIMAMFQTFMSEDEKIIAVEYFGKYGIAEFNLQMQQNSD